MAFKWSRAAESVTPLRCHTSDMCARKALGVSFTGLSLKTGADDESRGLFTLPDRRSTR